MGFSLRNLFDDTVAQLNPFDHGQSAATNQQLRAGQAQAPQRNLQPAVTPAPGALRVAAPAPTPSINLAPASILPAPQLHVAAPLQAPQIQVPSSIVPADATTTYHDKNGNLLGWEDPRGSHVAPTPPPAPAAPDTRSLGSKLWDQLNPLDAGRSYKQATPPVKYSENSAKEGTPSLIHQITHNGATNATGSLLNNVLAVPTIIDAARLGVDELSGNQPAIDNATTSLAKNLPRFLPIGAAEDFKNGFGQDLATTITTPFAEHSAAQQADEVRKQFNNHTGDPVHDAQVEAYASSVEGDLLNQHLNTAGIDMNTPTSTVVRKVAGHAGSTAANIIFMDQMGNGALEKFAPGLLPAAAADTTAAGTDAALNDAKDSLLKQTLTASGKAGTANATAAIFGVMGSNDPTVKDYIKAGATGFASGAAFPVALEGLAQTPKLIDYANTHVDTIKSLKGNEIGAIGKDVTQPAPLNPEQPPKILDQTNPEVAQAAKKTGVVDSQLKNIQDAKKSVINTATDELMAQQPQRDIFKEIRQAGGISSSDHENIPTSLKNKNGMAMDDLATQLGFPHDQALMDAIDNHQPALTKAQARAQVQQELESGQHPYSPDYAQMVAAEKARMDELSQYPKGTRSQVKVNNGTPPPMTDAEFQSLANQPEAQVKPAGNKVPVIDDKNVIRNADAERSVLDSLQKGTPTDSILTQYQKDTGVTLQQAVKDVNRVAKEANIETNLGKNPLLDPKNPNAIKPLPSTEDGNWKQATLNSRFIQYKEQAVGHQALDAYNALSPKDQVLLKQIENKPVSEVAKSAENPEAFKAADQALRNYFDTRHAYDTQLGIDVGYRTNYIRHFFDKAQEGDVVPTGDEQLRGGGANKAPGYTKARTVEALAKNVGDALERDISQSSFNHAKLAYENGLNDAFPGKIANGEIPRSGNDGKYVQIDHPFGNDLSAPKDIAKEINSRTWHENDSKALDVYDQINHGLKYVKLSGGLFHAFTESGNFLGQQFASGKILTDPGATAKLAQIFFSDKAMHNEVARMADTGVLDKAHLAGLQIRSDQILADANVKSLDRGSNFTPSENPAAKARDFATKYTGIQAMHDATFQREIPYAKLKIFEQKTAGLDPNVPADMAKIRQVADGINNVFGGINREVQGIKPGTFKWLQRGILATDFTEGKFKTLADAISKYGADNPQGRTARQVVAGKAILFGLLATAGAAAGGNYDGKSKSQIARDAAGNLIDPQFEMGGYKVGLPKTHISEVVDAVKPTQNNGKAWNASGLLSYVQNRSAALPSEAIQLLSNKNYYGQPLYGTNTKKNGGGQISAPQAGLNIAQTVLPIPFGQATNTVSGKQAPAAAVANIVGFKAKPNPDNTQNFQGTNVTLNDKQSEAYQTALKANTDKLTPQLLNSDAYKNAKPNDQATMRSELKQNITSATARDFASKNNLGQFAPDYKGKGSQASTKEQDVLNGTINPDAYVPNSGNTDSAAVAAFKKGNARSTQIGNDTYYKTKDGTVKHQNTFDYNVAKDSSKIALNLDMAKANDNYPAWKDAALSKYQLIQKQINNLDPETESSKVDDLTKQANDLVDQMRTYASYNGFTKPKSGRARTRSSNGITYKVFDPSSLNKSLRDIVAAAKV